VVEDEGGRQTQAGGGVEAVAQLHGGERVEAEVAERQLGVDGGGGVVAQHGGGVGADQVEQQLAALGRVEPGHPLGQAAAGGAARGYPDEAAQEGWRVAEAGQVQLGRYEDGLPEAECGVEQGQPVAGGERGESVAGEPAAVGLVEVAGHAAGVGPESPGE
jgi:hypothetical protein